MGRYKQNPPSYTNQLLPGSAKAAAKHSVRQSERGRHTPSLMGILTRMPKSQSQLPSTPQYYKTINIIRTLIQYTLVYQCLLVNVHTTCKLSHLLSIKVTPQQPWYLGSILREENQNGQIEKLQRGKHVNLNSNSSGHGISHSIPSSLYMTYVKMKWLQERTAHDLGFGVSGRERLEDCGLCTPLKVLLHPPHKPQSVALPR